MLKWMLIALAMFASSAAMAQGANQTNGSLNNGGFKFIQHCTGNCATLSPPAVMNSFQVVLTGGAPVVAYWFVTTDGQCASSVVHQTDPQNPINFATPVTGTVITVDGKQSLQFFNVLGFSAQSTPGYTC